MAVRAAGPVTRDPGGGVGVAVQVPAGTPSRNQATARSGAGTPLAVENFRALKDRQTADEVTPTGGHGGRVNLLNWDGKGAPPPGLFPERKEPS